MAIFIKANCGDCADAACDCTWPSQDITLPSPGWTGTQIDTFTVTGYFTTGGSVHIDIFDDGSTQRIKVYANGSLVYDSGVITTPVTTSFSVPAGTTSLEVDTIRTVGGDSTLPATLGC